jgi:hypothetical protein
MTDTQMVRGTNFTCFHAGPKNGWTQFRLEPPDVPMPAELKADERHHNPMGTLHGGSSPQESQL